MSTKVMGHILWAKVQSSTILFIFQYQIAHKYCRTALELQMKCCEKILLVFPFLFSRSRVMDKKSEKF